MIRRCLSIRVNCAMFCIFQKLCVAFAFTRSKPDDQDNLEDILRKLPPSHTWRLKKVKTQGEGILVVHQSQDQRSLLLRYGNELCLLDATYKTSKYVLPVFFVAVKANTCYQVVASFIVSEETSESIAEAMTIIKSWNPSWKPGNWMTDCCQAEISALEKVFPGK